MKIMTFEIEIPKYKTYTNIVIVGDVHRGNKYFDQELWNQYYIGNSTHVGFRDEPNTYVLCIGDLMETAFKDSLGEQDQSEWIEDQYLWTKKWLQPIRDTNRLIALVEGNHEHRATKNWFRTTRLLAKELNVPYCKGTLIVNIILKKGDKIQEYKLCASHGAGGSTTIAGKVNSIKKLCDIVSDADIYTVGHLHDKISVSAPTYIDNIVKERILGMTGAYLNYGGYAEEKMYKPASRGSLKVKLHLDIHRVSAR